jgi:hypothetical protein
MELTKMNKNINSARGKSNDAWEFVRPHDTSPHYVINERNASRNTDKPFKPDPNDPALQGVTRYEEVFGFVCVRKDPFGLWNIHRAPEGAEIPQELSGHYTTLPNTTKAIEAYLGKEANRKAQEEADKIAHQNKMDQLKAENDKIVEKLNNEKKAG